MSKTVVNQRPEVNERIDNWMAQEKNQNALERLQGMTKEQLVRSCVSAWLRNDDLEQKQTQHFRKEVDRFVEHSPKTQEAILDAIENKPEIDHYKIARGIANKRFESARTFEAGKQQGKGAQFMERFKKNATEQGQSQTQEQTVTR
jgi:hypothetical protein